MIQVVFLGSGDAFGSGGRLQTCLLLRGGADGVLIDCGATSLVALKRAGIEPNDIGSVAVSHLHGDHFGGLPFLVLDGQFRRRQRPLLIAGPAGLAVRLPAAMEVLFPGSAAAQRWFETRVMPLEPGRATPVGPATVTAFEVVHASGAPALALRLEYGGKVIAYSGDTEWTPVLLRAAAGADLFICESYFFDKRIPYHLDYRTLRDHQGEFGCKRLVLTHMNADLLAHLDEVEVEWATDGMVITLD